MLVSLSDNTVIMSEGEPSAKKDLYVNIKLKKYKASTAAEATHNGLAPTPGKWALAGYPVDAGVREELFKQIEDFKGKQKQFCITENIKGLSEDALTRLRFDVDMNLKTAEPVLNTPEFHQKFLNCLWSILHKHTNLTGSSRIVVLEKPAPTRCMDSYKHGVKYVCSDIACTHEDMKAIRSLMNSEYESWGCPEWLQPGESVHDSRILDPVVYEKNGWLLFGSQKESQLSGGYQCAGIFADDTLAKLESVQDYSFGALLRAQSIFHLDQNTVPLQWASGERPPVYRKEKRKQETQGTAAAAPRQRKRRAVGAPSEEEEALTTERVLELYHEAGGRLQLQERTDEDGTLYWVEKSPGADGRPCLAEAHTGEMHTRDAILRENSKGLIYICMSEEGVNSYIWERVSDEDLLKGGDRGIAKLVARLRGRDIKNVNGDNDNAEYYCYTAATCLWERRFPSFIRAEVIPCVLAVLEPLLQKALKDLKKVEEELKKRDPELSEGLLQKEEELRNECSSWLSLKNSLNSNSKLQSVLQLLQHEVRDEKFLQLLDSNKDVLSVTAGIVDLKTQTLRPRVREDYFSKALDMVYDPAHPLLPLIRQLMADITLSERLDRPEYLEFFQRLLGYGFTGHTSLEIFAIFLGSGSNGKSMMHWLLDGALQHLFYAAPKSLMARTRDANAGGTSSHIMALKGKRMAGIEELPDDELDENQIKTFSGGGKVSGRRLHHEQESFVVEALVLANANDMIKLPPTLAIKRRVVFCPFDGKFYYEDDPEASLRFDPSNKMHFIRDDTLKAREELIPAFFAWVVEGAAKWYKHGLGKTPSCCDAVKRVFQASNDKVQCFIDDCCNAPAEGTLCRALEAYMAYNEYITRLSERPLTKTKFYAAMEEKGFTKQQYKGQGQYRDKECLMGISL